NVPTPPAAPLTKTFIPDCVCPFSPKRPRRRPCNAVNPAIGTAAACANDTFAGFRASFDSEAHAYSAKAPRAHPKTASPGLDCVTLVPTASSSGIHNAHLTKLFKFLGAAGREIAPHPRVSGSGRAPRVCPVARARRDQRSTAPREAGAAMESRRAVLLGVVRRD